MATELRRTGIGELDDQPWGTHFCLFYETKEDLLDLVIPFFKAGLADREFCLYVASEPVSAEAAEQALREALPDFERYLTDGQIEITPHRSWYLAGGNFDPQRVQQGWIEKLDQALARGYAGMRFTASAFWLEKQDWRTFAEYEATLDDAFRELRVLAVCAYAVEQCSAADMLDVVRHHQFTLARRHGVWEHLEGSELARAHADIRRLNANLEGQVEQRTAQLASVNAHLTEEVAERRRSEAALRRSDERLQLVIDTMPALVWGAMPDGAVDFINERHHEFTGLSLDDVRGWRWTEVIHPEDRAQLVEAWRLALATSEPLETEARLKRAAGDYRWMLIRAMPLRDDVGQIIRWFGTKTDIEDRKQAEAALRQSEAELSEAQRVAHLGNWSLDIATNAVRWSAELYLIFDVEPTAFDGLYESFLARVHTDDRMRLAQVNAQLRASGQAFEVEYRIVTRGGQLKHIREIGYARKDGAGVVSGLFGTAQDITKRKLAEAETRRQAARAETLARIAARLNRQLELEAVIRAVCQEVISTFQVSQATMSLYDKTRDLLVYAGGVNMLPEYEATIEPISRTRFEELVRTLGPIMVVPDIQAMPDVPNVEFSSRLDVRTVVTAVMLRDQELIGALVVGVNGQVRQFAADDLTLLKAVSDLAAQAIANAQLLKAANAQHEQLRALSARLAEAQEAERRAVARELHDEIGQQLYAVSANLEAMHIASEASILAERLADSAALVDEAIQQVRDLALELRPSMLDDFGLVPALSWLIERQAQRAGFQAGFTADPPDLRLPASLETAAYRVVQIALTNVARHAQARQVTISVRQQGPELELLIHDDGVGFDVAVALESAQHGATLGLASMQERARLAGGTLEINSVPGQGTTIRVRLPIDQPSGS